jgi:hypothetical protein
MKKIVKGKISNRRKFLKDMTALTVALSAAGPINSAGFEPLESPDRRIEPLTFDDPIKPDEHGVFIIKRGEHKPEEIIAANAEISPVEYMPPSDRWQNLPITLNALATDGGELMVVMLGDSIVNDTYRSQWGDLLQARYKNCKITVIAIVRGSTGCWWYKENGRVEHYVLPQHPGLLIIGGISQKGDIDSIREVIEQVRAPQPCDVLLMTGAFGETDPLDDKQWTYDIPVDTDNYRKNLLDLSVKLGTGFLDMTAYWGHYIRESDHSLDWFKRDPIHANIRGEQVLGHILAAHFSPPLPK